MGIMRYFRVDTIPRGQGRPRFRVIPVKQNGKMTQMVTTYKTKEDKAHEKEIRDAYLATYRGVKPLEGTLAVTIVAYYPIPQSTTKRMREAMLSGEVRPEKKPDLDNVVKSVLDACNGVVWDDDKQVCSILASKRYETPDDKPGLEVFIHTME